MGGKGNGRYQEALSLVQPHYGQCSEVFILFRVSPGWETWKPWQAACQVSGMYSANSVVSGSVRKEDCGALHGIWI